MVERARGGRLAAAQAADLQHVPQQEACDVLLRPLAVAGVEVLLEIAATGGDGRQVVADRGADRDHLVLHGGTLPKTGALGICHWGPHHSVHSLERAFMGFGVPPVRRRQGGRRGQEAEHA